VVRRVLAQIVEIKRPERVREAALTRAVRVGEQPGDLHDVHLGVPLVSLDGLGGRDRAQQFPQKSHVSVVQRPVHRQVVQLV